VQHDGEGWRCLVAQLIWQSAKPMQRSPAASSQEARTLHKHSPIETGNRPHGFYARGDGTIVAFHATPDTKPIEGSAGTASRSDARTRDDRRITCRRAPDLTPGRG
jgi:hypothetical protein